MTVTYDEPFGPFFGKAFREAHRSRQRETAVEAGRTPPLPGIYALKFATGHIYIGSAINLAQRERQHRSRTNKPVKIIRYYLVHGYAPFEFKVLAVAPAGMSRKDLFPHEKRAIERAVASGATVLNTTWV